MLIEAICGKMQRFKVCAKNATNVPNNALSSSVADR